MIVLYGIRKWKSKVVAYRNDFCLSCEEPRRAHQIRSIKALHLFFIPVLPLYLWWHWECSECGQPPHRDPQPRSRRRIPKFLSLFSGMFALVVWVSPGSETGNSPAANWALRIVLTIAFAVSLWYMLKPTSNVRLSEKLKEVQPDEGNFCPLCQAPLILGDGWRCSGCGAERTAARG